jgi:hypothetical protein
VVGVLVVGVLKPSLEDIRKIVALPLLLGSTRLVAVSITVWDDAIVLGAV